MLVAWRRIPRQLGFPDAGERGLISRDGSTLCYGWAPGFGGKNGKKAPMAGPIERYIDGGNQA